MLLNGYPVFGYSWFNRDVYEMGLIAPRVHLPGNNCGRYSSETFHSPRVVSFNLRFCRDISMGTVKRLASITWNPVTSLTLQHENSCTLLLISLAFVIRFVGQHIKLFISSCTVLTTALRASRLQVDRPSPGRNISCAFITTPTSKYQLRLELTDHSVLPDFLSTIKKQCSQGCNDSQSLVASYRLS